MKIYYEEYERIKDKGILISSYQWRTMPEEEQKKLLSEKTVIIDAGSGYAHKKYRIVGNVSNLFTKECAIIADGGNLCFGYRSEGGGVIAVYTD